MGSIMEVSRTVVDVIQARDNTRIVKRLVSHRPTGYCAPTIRIGGDVFYRSPFITMNPFPYCQQLLLYLETRILC